MSTEELANKNVQVLFKNQGVYNGLISVGILYAVFFRNNSRELLFLIMLYITIVGLCASISSGNKLIVFKQAGLAMLMMILLFVFH